MSAKNGSVLISFDDSYIGRSEAKLIARCSSQHLAVERANVALEYELSLHKVNPYSTSQAEDDMSLMSLNSSLTRRRLEVAQAYGIYDNILVESERLSMAAEDTRGYMCTWYETQDILASAISFALHWYEQVLTTPSLKWKFRVDLHTMNTMADIDEERTKKGVTAMTMAIRTLRTANSTWKSKGLKSFEEEFDENEEINYNSPMIGEDEMSFISDHDQNPIPSQDDQFANSIPYDENQSLFFIRHCSNLLLNYQTLITGDSHKYLQYKIQVLDMNMDLPKKQSTTASSPVKMDTSTSSGEDLLPFSLLHFRRPVVLYHALTLSIFVFRDTILRWKEGVKPHCFEQLRASWMSILIFFRQLANISEIYQEDLKALGSRDDKSSLRELSHGIGGLILLLLPSALQALRFYGEMLSEMLNTKELLGREKSFDELGGSPFMKHLEHASLTEMMVLRQALLTLWRSYRNEIYHHLDCTIRFLRSAYQSEGELPEFPFTPFQPHADDKSNFMESESPVESWQEVNAGVCIELPKMVWVNDTISDDSRNGRLAQRLRTMSTQYSNTFSDLFVAMESLNCCELLSNKHGTPVSVKTSIVPKGVAFAMEILCKHATRIGMRSSMASPLMTDACLWKVWDGEISSAIQLLTSFTELQISEGNAYNLFAPTSTEFAQHLFRAYHAAWQLIFHRHASFFVVTSYLRFVKALVQLIIPFRKQFRAIPWYSEESFTLPLLLAASVERIVLILHFHHQSVSITHQALTVLRLLIHYAFLSRTTLEDLCTRAINTMYSPWTAEPDGEWLIIDLIGGSSEVTKARQTKLDRLVKEKTKAMRLKQGDDDFGEDDEEGKDGKTDAAQAEKERGKGSGLEEKSLNQPSVSSVGSKSLKPEQYLAQFFSVVLPRAYEGYVDWELYLYPKNRLVVAAGKQLSSTSLTLPSTNQHLSPGILSLREVTVAPIMSGLPEPTLPFTLNRLLELHAMKSEILEAILLFVIELAQTSGVLKFLLNEAGFPQTLRRILEVGPDCAYTCALCELANNEIDI